MVNDVPMEVALFLREKASDVKDVTRVKMMLMSELGIRGKEAKKYAKWWIGEENGGK